MCLTTANIKIGRVPSAKGLVKSFNNFVYIVHLVTIFPIWTCLTNLKVQMIKKTKSSSQQNSYILEKFFLYIDSEPDHFV
jgi:hypothetical protein